MSNSATFKIKITTDDGDVKDMTLELGNLDSALEAIVKSANKVENELRDMVDASILLETTNRALQGISDMTMSLASQFNSFETAMRKANTMAGKSGEDFDALNDSIVDLSKNIPLARESLADGLYQVISNGVPEDN